MKKPRQKLLFKSLAMLILLIGLLTPSLLFAQTILKGKVVDEKNLPLPGAGIKLKLSGKTTVTNDNGEFNISAAANEKTFVVSFIGYQSIETTIAIDTKSYTIKLTPNSKNLEEVVVIGYGEQKKKDLTGAISSIKAEDIKNLAQAGIDQMLQGRVAGVSVTQNSGAPGGGVSVKIRGISSFGSTEPLYVIDGVPIDGNTNNDALSIAGDGETKMSALTSLNPADILTIDILKDASATAIYGNKAANGVVIITTKSGKVGLGKITFDSYIGTSSNSRYIDLLNLQQYASYKNTIADYRGDDRQPQYADASLLGNGTDWQREIFTKGTQQNYQLALSGGAKGTSYYVSGNYFDQQGTIIGSGLTRKSVRVNIDNQVKPWLKLGVNATYSNTDQKITLTNNANNSYGNVIAMAIQQSPDVPVYNIDGTFGGPDERQANGGLGSVGAGNPVAQATTWHTALAKNRLLGNLFAQSTFGKHFTFRSDYGTDYNWNKASTFLPTYIWGTVKNTLNKMELQTTNSIYWNWRNVLTYKTSFGKNDITAMLGHEASKSNYDAITSARSKFLTNDVTTLNQGDPATASATEGKGQNAQESIFARVIYSYNGKYSLTGTVRADKSSNFAEGNRIGYFPAMAGAWTISQEDFLKSNKTFNFLKLRVGYGEVGNQNIPSYRWGVATNQTFINQVAFGSGNGQLIANRANPDLTWEHQSSLNIGLDIGIINRFDINFDFYNKISDNFLFPDPAPYISGIGVPNQGTAGGIEARYVNFGKMQNRGIDINLSYHSKENSLIGWKSNIVFSHYKNTVKELTNGLNNIYKSISTNGNQTISNTVVGGPVGQFYGLQVKGIFRTLDQLYAAPKQYGNNIDPKTGTYLGDIQYVDQNGDGVIDDNDRVVIGNPNPKFTFGFNNNISWKNFDATIFITGSYGNDVYNYTRVWGEAMTSASGNAMASVQYRWTPENPNTNMPRYANGDPNGNATRISNRFIEDGSYLRIQNIQLGYNIPVTKIAKLNFISKFRVYASVQNLYTLTHYSGYDPEIGSMNGNVFLTGIDLGRYPVPRTFTFGINTEF